jgi:NADH dehydrogenase/NADH:ubiquinone oxidoreductase subunit G
MYTHNDQPVGVQGVYVGPAGSEKQVITSTGALQNIVSIDVGTGTPITKIAVYAPSLTPASVAAATTAEQTFTVTGLTTADKVIVNGPAPTAGTGIVNARVSAANTLAITFANVTAAAATPTAGTYTIVAIRS